MAKLVVLSEGFKDRAFELKAEKMTVGRAEDNTFSIPEPSVSSHHCEISLRGQEVLIKDLNSTNGTFIDGDAVTDGVLKAGQILRLGQIELRLDDGTAAAAAPSKKAFEPPRGGVKLNDLETAHATKIDTNPMFRKKTNKINRIFLGVGLCLAVVVIALLLLVFLK